MTDRTPEQIIGGCREWIDEKCNYCFAPAEYVLWGKLIPPEGLGPRCYDHAAKHIDHHGLYRNSGYALIHLGELREAYKAEAKQK